MTAPVTVPRLLFAKALAHASEPVFDVYGTSVTAASALDGQEDTVAVVREHESRDGRDVDRRPRPKRPAPACGRNGTGAAAPPKAVNVNAPGSKGLSAQAPFDTAFVPHLCQVDRAVDAVDEAAVGVAREEMRRSHRQTRTGELVTRVDVDPAGGRLEVTGQHVTVDTGDDDLPAVHTRRRRRDLPPDDRARNGHVRVGGGERRGDVARRGVGVAGAIVGDHRRSAERIVERDAIRDARCLRSRWSSSERDEQRAEKAGRQPRDGSL
jgi:hypothetical protein